MATGGKRPAGRPSATDPAPLRVFFALWPDAPAHERVAAMAADVVARAGGRAPRPENIHLTVAFVGSVAPERIAALKRIGASAAHAVAPFTLELDRVGAFHHAGIAWLGADVLPMDLEDLAFALREELAAKSFPVEKRLYRAHVTLARGCGAMTSIRVAPVAWRVERLTLNASKLSSSGSRYSELAQWPLG